ncbi:MAG: diguanylate cyclase [Candidatus Electrothrix aestuarii]|uniref:Diguanylate cyclase n=1 Tax=Candidatus Electrothrix aestuarii TaxID=3062594 RepID=A0AAU8LU97_9BACT
MLQWFPFTIQNGLRVQDIVTRWGGEEFLVFLSDTSLGEAQQIAERPVR